MFKFASVLLSLVLWPVFLSQAHGQDTPRVSTKEIAKEELPKEAWATLQLIKQGGPFPYPRDGSVFGNFERRLPLKKRGYYREYTVPTPGRGDRGARRIVAGAQGEYYYTVDHYRTFRKIRAQP
jgi:ribonuclease T1